ncbi:MAG: Protein RecA [Planctomycetes bacterium]|nr:Protein RecA [Planctomycetota bacterium]
MKIAPGVKEQVRETRDAAPEAAPVREETRSPLQAPAQRAKALEATLSQIEKQFGKGAIMRLNEASRMAVQCVSTGALSLDIALGGGIPRGRIVEIFGPESSGKTTLTSHIVAEVQKTGGTAAFVDAEHAYDPVYAKRLGVNVDELLIAQPDNGEQALEIAEQLVRSNAVDVVVVDSVAALVPKAELEGEMGDSFVGLQARLMSQALRKLTGAVSRSDCTIIFTNQIREKIGVMFGSPETQPGGRALKFYASVRIDLRRIGQIKDRDEVIGNRTKATVVKNKIAPPFRRTEFDVLFNHGISREGDVIDLAVIYRIVEKSGSWLSWKGERLGQGRDRAKEFLAANPEVLKKLEAEVRTAAATTSPAAAAAGVDFGGGDAE